MVVERHDAGKRAVAAWHQDVRFRSEGRVNVEAEAAHGVGRSLLDVEGLDIERDRQGRSAEQLDKHGPSVGSPVREVMESPAQPGVAKVNALDDGVIPARGSPAGVIQDRSIPSSIRLATNSSILFPPTR